MIGFSRIDRRSGRRDHIDLTIMVGRDLGTIAGVHRHMRRRRARRWLARTARRFWR
jgi:hypothetical protein